jgi:hypothetical protein
LASIEPLFSVSCDDCRRSYLVRIDDLVGADGGCPVCRGPAVRVIPVPDAEDMRGLSRRELASDAVEYSRRLHQDSRRLRDRSAIALADAKSVLATMGERVAATSNKR